MKVSMCMCEWCEGENTTPSLEKKKGGGGCELGCLPNDSKRLVQKLKWSKGLKSQKYLFSAKMLHVLPER